MTAELKIWAAEGEAMEGRGKWERQKAKNLGYNPYLMGGKYKNFHTGSGLHSKAEKQRLGESGHI